MKLTLKELRKRVVDEADAYVLMEQLRWGDDRERLACPHCGHDRAYFLKAKDGQRITGQVKKDGTRPRSQRRVWKCAKCRKQFSVLTGTIFHGTKVPLGDWLTVMVLMASAKNGISAREVERLVGTTPETAWFMLHRLREAMKREPVAGMLSGQVVADETFIGPKMGSMNKKRRKAFDEPQRYNGKDLGGPTAGKTAVLSLIDTATGEVRSQVVPSVTGASLRKAIAEQVDSPATTLHTDGALAYKTFGHEFAAHLTTDHNSGEYVRYVDGQMTTTNQAESFFSQLKRSLDGTHHHVSPKHLPRYLAEFDFKYSTRKMTDTERLQKMVDQADGRRLTYRPMFEGR